MLGRGRATRMNARRGMDNRGMPTPMPSTDPDPRPQPPEAPLPGDCCDSGCTYCVHDIYSDALYDYRKALAEWKLRHPGASD